MVPMMYTHDDPILRLEEEQSWNLLENTQHGRIVLTAAGETDIFPINFRAHNGVLLLRTAPGTKLAELTINENVVFEADGILSDEAWSVVVKGKARVLTNSQEIADAEALNLKTWVPTLKDFYVEIKPSQVSGRHFNFGEQPERF
jgi:nitroimidazol reductase NimA-like FMN-containing flavoprotein (pyridoxamine 5'-phosphate oxidase superfamily)